VGGSRGIERQIEIVAERRAQRGLVAAVDLDLLDHRREQVRTLAGIEHAGNRLGLGLDRVHGRALASVTGWLRRHFRLARGLQCRLDLGQRPFGLNKRLLGGLALAALGRWIGQPAMRSAIPARSASWLAICRSSRVLRSPASRISRSSWVRSAAASARSAVTTPSDVSLSASFAWACLEGCLKGRGPLAAAFEAVLSSLSSSESRCMMPALSAIRRSSRSISALSCVSGGRVPRGAGNPLGFLVDLGPGDLQALQGGGGCGLGLAQFRQLVCGNGLVLGCLHLRLRQSATTRRGLGKRAFGLALLGLGQRPPQMQQRRLRLRGLSADRILKRLA
jgi:hypothetical protein